MYFRHNFILFQPCDSLRELVHNVLGQKEWSDPIHGFLRSEIEDDGFLDAGGALNSGTLRVTFLK